MVGMAQERNKMCSESDLTGLKPLSENIGLLWAVVAATGNERLWFILWDRECFCIFIDELKVSPRSLQHQEILRNFSDTVSSRKEQNIWISSYGGGLCFSEKVSFHVEWKVREGTSGSFVRLGISKHPTCRIWAKFYYFISHVPVVLPWERSKIGVFNHACFPFSSFLTTEQSNLQFICWADFIRFWAKLNLLFKNKNADLKFSRKPISNNTNFQTQAAASGENPAV